MTTVTRSWPDDARLKRSTALYLVDRFQSYLANHCNILRTGFLGAYLYRTLLDSDSLSACGLSWKRGMTFCLTILKDMLDLVEVKANNLDLSCREWVKGLVSSLVISFIGILRTIIDSFSEVSRIEQSVEQICNASSVKNRPLLRQQESGPDIKRLAQIARALPRHKSLTRAKITSQCNKNLALE